jgi:uncharacterized glyoxalase superfamily protein PhnB
MLGSCRDDEAGVKSPQTLGAVTQALYVYVPDVDAHFDRARLAGVEITTPPQDTGVSREYHVRDPEGHIWTFGTYLPNTDAA